MIFRFQRFCLINTSIPEQNVILQESFRIFYSSFSEIFVPMNPTDESHKFIRALLAACHELAGD